MGLKDEGTLPAELLPFTIYIPINELLIFFIVLVCPSCYCHDNHEDFKRATNGSNGPAHSGSEGPIGDTSFFV